MNKTEAAIASLIRETVSSAGASLVDVELQKNGKNVELCIFIDKPGGVFIEDCERVSRAVEPIIDEADPIEQSYALVVSSPGIDRPFRDRDDFLRAIGTVVEVRLYKAFQGKKLFTGELHRADEEEFAILIGEDAEMAFTYKEAAQVRPHIDFSGLLGKEQQIDEQ